MNEAVNEPSESEIITALNGTGFLLEHRVAQVLRRNGFEVSINYAFPDSENGKSREIDVEGYTEETLERDAREPFSVILESKLIVECKNTVNPFIVIGQRGEKTYSVDSYHVSFDPLALKFPKRKGYETIYSVLGLPILLNDAGTGDFLGYQLVRMNRQSGGWRADNNSVYDSILYPLAKAWAYFIKQRDEDDYEEDASWKWRLPYVDLLFPVVVTSGPVFIVDVTDEGAKVAKVGWAPIKRNFRAADVSGDFRLDIVSFPSLGEYLEARIKGPMRNIRERILSNLHLYDPEWLLANRGEPEDKEYFNMWLNDIRTRRQPGG